MLYTRYWSAAALTLEPRLSSRWIANIAFFGTIISLPVPEATFLLPDSHLYRPSPPPLASVIENILPSVGIRNHLSRGLQSTSALVQHCAAIALVKALVKYGLVLQAFRKAEGALEEDQDGQWWKRREEIEQEVARRVPELQVVLAFVQQKTNEVHRPSTHADTSFAKGSLLAESAQRLLWLYHEHLPSVVSGAHFDVGKLLLGVQDGDFASDTAVQGLDALRQLHVLRLLGKSEQFSLYGRSGGSDPSTQSADSLMYSEGSSKSSLSILLKLYVNSTMRPTKAAVSSLLKQTLSNTLIFQHNPDEVDSWLSALPFPRIVDAASDDSPFVHEVDTVIAFLDDCFQRCIKTPYRYLEELQRLWLPTTESDANHESHSTFNPSPLFAAVVEQYKAKIASKLLSTPELLSVTCFLRRLLWALAQTVDDITSLQRLAVGLRDHVGENRELVGSSARAGLQNELVLLDEGLSQITHPKPVGSSTSSAAQPFLDTEADDLDLHVLLAHIIADNAITLRTCRAPPVPYSTYSTV